MRGVILSGEEGSRSALRRSQRLFQQEEMSNHDFLHTTLLHQNRQVSLLYSFSCFLDVMARIKFPMDYPYSPPAFRFLTKMWHPNIYENGDVCISILHPPVDDPQSGELPSERWNPTQNVRTILLSVISLLNEPNTFSPANVDASVMYRKWRDSKGKDREYAEIIRKQVLATKADAERDGVKVPTTLAEYCIRTRAPPADEGSTLFYDDYYDDEELDDDEEEGEDCCHDEDDSGTEDS
uniref:Cell division cycle 34 homolog (S. cerevisiae) a n=1 Tax=Cyprinus carpio TaxID=7962 RepID=A0A8C2JXS6_CYPCA